MMDKLMKFTTLCFLEYNIVFDHVYADLRVHHTPDSISWSEASVRCGKNGLEDNVDNLKNSGILVEYEFWIGKAVFRELTPWIEVIGCWRNSSTNSDIKTYTVRSIGQCQTACNVEKVFGYQYKGLQRNCICFTKGVPNDLNIACDFSRDFVVHTCYNGNITHDSVDPGNCVTLCCGVCLSLQSHMLVGRNCNSNSGFTVARCQPFGVQFQQWGKSYNNSRTFCWQNDRLLLPPSFCRTDASFSNGVRAWTNIFRETFDIEKSVSNEYPTSCYTGILHQSGNETKKIVFTLKNCNSDTNWYICKDAKTVQHQTTANLFHETSFNQVSTIQPKSSLTVNISSAKPITTSQKALTNNSLTDDSSNKNSDTKSYTVGIIVGGVAGTVVLLLISAAILVCRIRSIGIFKGKEKTHDGKVELSKRPNYDSQGVNGSHVEPISNQNYGIAINQSTTYAVVDKLKKSDKKFTKNDATYSDLADGQYDQLNNIQKRKIILEGNLYNSHDGMRDQNDPTYDISKFSSHGTSHDVADVYDHSFLGTQNDGEYDYSLTYRSDLSNETEIYDQTI